mmetsp:Transcript_42811/g.71201  ORF Transcript_42811/g.71201 Transcript_42811/m.71201 type:complete len:86 (-) Transcript_42811:22-279(-)
MPRLQGSSRGSFVVVSLIKEASPQICDAATNSPARPSNTDVARRLASPAAIMRAASCFAASFSGLNFVISSVCMLRTYVRIKESS